MPPLLTLHATPNATRLPLVDQPCLLYLLLETEIAGVSDTAVPVNLSLVLDVSESMRVRLVSKGQFTELADQGMAQEIMVDGVPVWQIQNVPAARASHFPRKLDFVLAALRAVAEQLRPSDQLSLVAFAERADLLLPTTPAQDKAAIAQAERALARANLGDDTNMHLGMKLALAEVRGHTRPDVVNRLLLLTDGFTRSAAACWSQMAQAQMAGVAISTLGMGGEFNEDLLIPLAEQTGGRAYFVEDPTQLPDLFRQELTAVQAITYRRAELKLHLTPGVELRRVYRVRPLLGTIPIDPDPAGSYAVPLGDIPATSPPALLLELIAPPRPAGQYRLAQVLLSSDPVGAGRQTARQDVVVTVSADGTGPLNGRVMNIVERVTAFNLQTRALADAKAGDLAAATRKLQAAATRMLDMGEVELAQAIQQQAAHISQSTPLTAVATKRLRYQTDLRRDA